MSLISQWSNQHLNSSNEVGEKKRCYHRRSAETGMFRFKTPFDSHLSLRD